MHTKYPAHLEKLHLKLIYPQKTNNNNKKLLHSNIQVSNMSGCVVNLYLEESGNSCRSTFISVHPSHDSSSLDVSSTSVIRDPLKYNTYSLCALNCSILSAQITTRR